MERLAYYVVHHRRLVIGVWILLTAFGAFCVGQGRRPLARGLLDPGLLGLRANQRARDKLGSGEATRASSSSAPTAT